MKLFGGGKNSKNNKEKSPQVVSSQSEFLDDASSFISSKPYLLRGLHQWMERNHWTAYITIHAYAEGVCVPEAYVNRDQMVLNISSQATRNLTIDDDFISFLSTFGGVVKEIFVPMSAVLNIYAKENGRGMEFLEEPNSTNPPPKPPKSSSKAQKSSGNGVGGKTEIPYLRVVK